MHNTKSCTSWIKIIINRTILKLSNPQIALIGVGENNKYGHPDNDVIFKLQKLRK